MTATDETTTESVDSFRARAAAWIPDHLPRIGAIGRDDPVTRRVDDDGGDPTDPVTRGKALQRIIFDGGFAGVCYPVEYGGLGLTPAHMHAFNQECKGYELSSLTYFGMTFGMIGPTILDFGTEDQKRRHIRGFLTGDNIWIQFLSEPTGGSDLASVLTRADRDGDEWIVNGSKIWTSYGDVGDYGLLVARTNWDVPKHSGISVFICPVHTPGLEVQPLRLVTGSTGFCQEFFTDVRIPDTDRLGEVDDGWTVGTRWMFHERNAMGGGSPYLSGTRLSELESMGSSRDRLFAIAERNGDVTDPLARDRVGEGIVLSRASRELSQRIGEGMAAGVFSDAAAAITRLMSGVVGTRRATLGLELAGPAIAASSEDDPAAFEGQWYLNRQAGSIGGGTTEMARNNISERVLGMPREVTHDKNMPYRDVPKGPPAKG